MSVPSYPFHSFLLKLPNKGMSFPFSPLKLLNKKMEEYSKMIFFISFHSIPFPPPKRRVEVRQLQILRFYLALFLFMIFQNLINGFFIFEIKDQNFLLDFFIFLEFKLGLKKKGSGSWTRWGYANLYWGGSKQYF